MPPRHALVSSTEHKDYTEKFLIVDSFHLMKSVVILNVFHSFLANKVQHNSHHKHNKSIIIIIIIVFIFRAYNTSLLL
jgi:hypothetical protein